MLTISSQPAIALRYMTAPRAVRLLTPRPWAYQEPRLYSPLDETSVAGHRLLDLASATVIDPGAVVSDTLDPGNATNLYQFNANTGHQFYFDVLSGDNYANNWRLIDPYGQQVWFSYLTPYDSPGTQILAATGTYTLLIEGDVGNSNPVDYSFDAQPVMNTTAALALGTQVDSAIAEAGQQNQYTFSLANASQLYFDSLTDDFLWLNSGPVAYKVKMWTQDSITSVNKHACGIDSMKIDIPTKTVTIESTGSCVNKAPGTYSLPTEVRLFGGSTGTR